MPPAAVTPWQGAPLCPWGTQGVSVPLHAAHGAGTRMKSSLLQELRYGHLPSLHRWLLMLVLNLNAFIPLSLVLPGRCLRWMSSLL